MQSTLDGQLEGLTQAYKDKFGVESLVELLEEKLDEVQPTVNKVVKLNAFDNLPIIEEGENVWVS